MLKQIRYWFGSIPQMDSGNSGSLQSSRELDLASSAEEEYDSRTESISAFMNPSRSKPCSNPNLNAPQNTNANPSALFDSLSNYLDSLPRSPISNPNLINLERQWSLLYQNSTISPFMAAGSSAEPAEISNFSANPNRVSTVAQTPDQNIQQLATKTGKKRSRASRRAPTTVLTTDTSNFRAMVQEFTGIPAPPFSASPFSRNLPRLDLLSSIKSRSDPQSLPPPPFLLRPFPQKVISSPAFTTTTTVATHPSTSSPNPTSFDLQNPSSSTSSSIPNSFLNFQSLLNPSPKFQFPMLGTKLHEFGSTSVVDSNMKVGLMEEFAINAANVNVSLGAQIGSVLPNLVSSDMNRNNGNNNSTTNSSNNNNNNNNSQSWGDGSGLNDEDQSYLRSTSAGNYCNSQRVSSCKLNYNASATDFHVDKGSESIPRGEGMVDSWICSSD